MLKIEFDREIYRPGDEIKAYITLNLPVDTKIRFGDLRFTYYMIAREGGKTTFIKKILDEELSFMDEGRYLKGVYSYNIKYKLPDNIPPTYRGRVLDCVLYYECKVIEKDGYEYIKKGEIKITEKPKVKSRETIYTVGSGRIHINLSIPEPIVGKTLLGVLSIEQGLDLIRRVGIDICFYEGYRVEKLRIFKGFKEITRCIPIYNIVISRDEFRYPLRIDLSKALKGRSIYTSPYDSELVSYKPYLRIRLTTREGGRIYHIPIKWYPHFEEEISEVIAKDVYTMEEKAKRLILKFFEDYVEGDIIDIQKFLLIQGININIYTIEKLLKELIEDELVVVTDDNPILRRYRFNAP